MARFNTRQEVMDHVCAHLSKQGIRAGLWVQDSFSKALSFRCSYLNNEGDRCAIGACLDNPSELSELGLGGDVWDLCEHDKDVMDRTFGPDIDGLFLYSVQSTHDKNPTWDEMKLGYRALCERHKLTPPPELQERA